MAPGAKRKGKEREMREMIALQFKLLQGTCKTSRGQKSTTDLRAEFEKNLRVD